MDNVLDREDGEFELYVMDLIESSSKPEEIVDSIGFVQFKYIVRNKFYPTILDHLIKQYGSTDRRIMRVLSKEVLEITYNMHYIRDVIALFVVLNNSIINTKFEPQYMCMDSRGEYVFTKTKNGSGTYMEIDNFELKLCKMGNILCIYFDCSIVNDEDGKIYTHTLCISLHCRVTLYTVNGEVITIALKCS